MEPTTYTQQLQAMERCRRAQEQGRTAKTERLFETNEAIKASAEVLV